MMAKLPRVITEIVVAMGPLGVWALPIWGDWIRSHIAGPKWSIS